MPSAAAPIDGSVKCLVSLVLIAVLLLKFGFHAGSSSMTYRFLSAFIYFAKTSLSKVSSVEVQSSLNVSSVAAIETFLAYERITFRARCSSFLSGISFRENISSVMTTSQ